MSSGEGRASYKILSEEGDHGEEGSTEQKIMAGQPDKGWLPIHLQSLLIP